jgi:hypothetical protein
MSHFPEVRLDPHIIITLQRMLHNQNPYAIEYKYTQDYLQENP